MVEKLTEVERVLVDDMNILPLRGYPAVYALRSSNGQRLFWTVGLPSKTQEEAKRFAMRNAIPGTVRVFEIPERAK